MSKLRLIIPLVTGLALAAIASQALAFAGAQAISASRIGVPRSATAQQEPTNLSAITVYGQRLPFPIELQLYKKALTRAWSNDPADANQLVCRWRARTDTRLQTLFCQTNRDHQKLYMKQQMALFLAPAKSQSPTPILTALATGQIPVQLAGLTTQKTILRSTMAPLLKKLPAADASYTLRVTGDNGKPILDYVMKNGNLVHIYHYVYKSGKAGDDRH